MIDDDLKWWVRPALRENNEGRIQYVIPAQAGIQDELQKSWTPASAGVT